MPKDNKTNALRLLEAGGISFDTLSYETGGDIDGVSVAKKVGAPPSQVYKTLLTKGVGRDYYVFVIPVADELDLKKAARAAGEKSITMAPLGELQKLTGYVRGGCSPIGMKKAYPTFIHEEAMGLDRMMVSAGRIGLQLCINPHDLAGFVSAQFFELTATQV